MNRFMKHVRIIIIVLFITGSILGSSEMLFAANKNGLELGDYISYGAYNGETLLWKVVSFDKEGNPLLVSEHILSYKPFDSSESGEFGMIDESLDTAVERQQYGSNRWENSNIREWLNSNNTIVDYSTSIPSEDGVWDNSNDYAEEQGFLSNFTAKEQLGLLPVLNETIISMSDATYADSGVEAHQFLFGTPEETLINYDESYKEKTIDQVFLLSIDEVYRYLQLGGYSFQRDATQSAYDLDESNRAAQPGNPDSYWLRDATGNSATSVRSVTKDGKVNYDSAYYNNVGILPALYLNGDIIALDKGDGGSLSPYTIAITDDKVSFEDKNLESAVRDVIDKPSGTLYASDVNQITSLYASGRQISSISGLEMLTNLRTLDISYNEVEDFSPINSFYGLRELYAQYNQLEDLTPIIEMVVNNYSPNEMIIDITGNLLDINDEANQSNFSYIEMKGATITYDTDIYKSIAIEALITEYLAKYSANIEDDKEALVGAIELEMNELGAVDVEAENNTIFVSKDTLQGIAQDVITVEKEASRQLQEKEISINREIGNQININVINCDLSSPFTIKILEEITNYTAIDKVFINLDGCVIGFEPSELSKDFLRDETLKIIISESQGQRQTIEVLGEDIEEGVNLPLSTFAATMNEKAKAAIVNQSDNARRIINNGTMVTLDAETSIYHIAFEKNGQQLERIEESISFGVVVPEENIYSCIIREDNDHIEGVGGIYSEAEQMVYIETDMASSYYLTHNKTSFDDIYDLDEATIQAIQVLAAKNILSAREEGLFMPSDTISREEIAAAIVKLTFMYDETAESNFTDVDKESPYYSYISSSEINGIINGYPDNTFRPDVSISNAELTKLTSAIMVYYGNYIYPIESSPYLTYSNQLDIPEWVHDYLALASREGIIDASISEYLAGDEITRAEAALTLYKILQKM